MKILFISGVILALASAAFAEEDTKFEDLVSNKFHEEYNRLTNPHRSVRELANELVKETKGIAHNVVGYAKNVLAGPNGARVKRSEDGSTDNKNPLDGLISGGLEALMQQLASGSKPTGAAAPPSDGGDSSTTTTQATPGSDPAADAARAGIKFPKPANNGKPGGALPLPLILIPGKPGPPGFPGLPGLPGKNGKLPNFKGLKAIVSAKVAKILALIAAVFVGVIIKTGALIALVLGITLPIYGKLKKAGAVLPVPTGPYDEGIRIPAEAADNLAYDVLPKVDAGYSKYGGGNQQQVVDQPNYQRRRR